MSAMDVEPTVNKEEKNTNNVSAPTSNPPMDDSSSDDDDVPLSDLLAKKKRSQATASQNNRSVKKSKSSDEEEEEESSDDDDVPLAARLSQKKKSSKKAKPEKKKRSKSKTKRKSSSTSKRKSSSKKNGDEELVLHKASKYEAREKPVPLLPVKGANKWWNRTPEEDGADDDDDDDDDDDEVKEVKKSGKKWEQLEHNGVLFPPDYEPHGVKMLYDGAPVDLTPEQEEVATWYAVMLETDYVKNPVFNVNFFKDWKKVLGKSHTIQRLDKCDFRPIFDWAMKEREEKKERRKDPKVREVEKEEKAVINEIYGYALVDGFREKVGNFRIEPPGLFRGRGEHPKTGKIKFRVRPEDVTINIGRGVPIPKAPEGHQWKGIIHNKNVTWLAYWNNNINNDFKYVFLAASSQFKGESDRRKYEKARRLKKYIGKIREDYNMRLTGDDEHQKQLATTMYLIDRLALRVGNEKDTSEEADTVGCCSLRVEHLKFNEDNNILFDFLGKDSMRYLNEAKVDPRVYENMKSFCVGKNGGQDVFHLINPTFLNTHLKSLMPGLTAKVFRTYNASVTLEDELRKEKIDINDMVAKKLTYYNNANREVAILCNHQRSVPKAYDTQMEKLQTRLKELKDLKAGLKEHLDELNGKPAKKKNSKKVEGKRYSNNPDMVKDQIKKMQLRIENVQHRIEDKDNTKTVALGTAKINYMDPRITTAWCKSAEMPIEKCFSKSLIAKFPWAMEVESTWSF